MAAYAALREVGLERLIAVGWRSRRKLLFTAIASEGLALPGDSRGAASGPAHPRRGAPVRRDVPSPPARPRDLRSALDEIPGIGARRRKQLLTRFGSLAGVRRAQPRGARSGGRPKTGRGRPPAILPTGDKVVPHCRRSKP
jgi:excinuclease ABC subunit C